MGTITIVGLGPGAVGHLSLETMGLLQNCAQVILRTAVHPTVAELEKQNVKFTSCDDLYEKAASFEEVYDSVVERVLAAAQNGDVVYADQKKRYKRRYKHEKKRIRHAGCGKNRCFNAHSC